MSESQLVRLVQLGKRFTKGKETISIFEDLEFSIAAGDFVAVMGPSGSGKTTLLNMIGGIDRPDAGEIHVAGRRIDRLPEGELAKWRAATVGFVFQFYNLIPSLTARENVALVTDISRNPMKPADALALVELSLFACISSKTVRYAVRRP